MGKPGFHFGNCRGFHVILGADPDDAWRFERVIGAVEITHFLLRNPGEAFDAENVARQCQESLPQRFFDHHGRHEVDGHMVVRVGYGIEIVR